MTRLSFAALAAVLCLLGSAAVARQPPRATIYRDAWGVPHVLSDTDQGALFGMAWALSEDDWPLIEENYLHALGRYAELVGEAGVRDDWMARALEIVPLSIKEYHGASPRSRGLLDAFAAGMNAWLAARRQPAGVLEKIEPWYPLALIRYKYYQNEFLGYAGLRAPWAQRMYDGGWPAGANKPPVPAAGETGAWTDRYYEAQFDVFGRRPHGSNHWAIAPSRTRDKRALLLLNPHQRFVGVQRYAEIHLDSREGLRFSGLTVFGFLLPYMGHNDRLGWAYTDNYADHSDLYAEAFDDPARPRNYRYGETRRDAVTWNETIAVRAADGSLARRPFVFWKTHHGPIVGVGDDGRPLAVRMARYEEGGWFDQWDAMIRARNRDQWRAAVAAMRVPYMNTMYADADGHIGYIYNSAVPRRLAGVDPSGVLEGSDPRTEWQGFHAFAELPQVWDPPSGWLMNTNSSPFTATTGITWTRKDFPSYMVGSEEHNPRAVSSQRVLAALDGATFETFARSVWDTRLSQADRVLPVLFAEWDAADAAARAELARVVGDAALAAAVARLKTWNRIADVDSVETTWFVVMAEQRRVGGAQAGRPWLVAFAAALRALQEKRGTIEVTWGTINRHQRPLTDNPREVDVARPSLAVGGASGGLGSVFSFETAPLDPSQLRRGVAGNSFVKVVEFGSTVRALSVLNYGQSGRPESPHFFDQGALYAARSFKPAWFNRDDVVKNAVRHYEVR